MERYGQWNAEVLDLPRCQLGSPLIPHDLPWIKVGLRSETPATNRLYDGTAQ